MSLDTDILVDRRRLKRRLIFWRVLAIIAVVLAIALMLPIDPNASGPFGQGAHIARIKVEGFIGDSKERHDMLMKLRDNENVKAVIVTVDSPGGTTSGGEALYNDLRMISEKKPVVSVFGTSATSAAYMCGIATDYIVAHGNTITGSVGVIFQWPQVSELLDKLGVKMEEVRSGPLKATPSLFSPTDERTRAVTQELVQESMNWFIGLVVERRKSVGPALDDIKTGRIYTGRQALTIGLVDALGDEQTAIKWLNDVKKVPSSLKVIDWKPQPRDKEGGLLRGAVSHMAAKLGLISPIEASVMENMEGFQDRPLDGLFSIWHG